MDMLAASGLETEASKESLCARVTLYRRKGMVEAERWPSGQRESTAIFNGLPTCMFMATAGFT